MVVTWWIVAFLSTVEPGAVRCIEVDHRDLISLLSFILRSQEAVKWYNTIEVTMAFF